MVRGQVGESWGDGSRFMVVRVSSELSEETFMDLPTCTL